MEKPRVKLEDTSKFDCIGSRFELILIFFNLWVDFFNEILTGFLFIWIRVDIDEEKYSFSP